MNNKEISSWLFRFRSKLKFISRIKTGILKIAYLLGDNLAHIMINLGYLIKNSAFFHNAAVKCELTRKSLYDKILNDKKIAQQEIVYLEFGVYKGKSFNYWLKSNQNQNSVFFGFDTFSGLPEDWGHLPKGSFNTGG